MVNYKEILRLTAEGYSQRQIEASLHCSKHTVKHTVRDVQQAAERAHLELLSVESITNEELAGILFPGKVRVVGEYLEPDYPHIHKELSRPKVTESIRFYYHKQRR